MRVISLVTRTEIEASPIVDGQTGKLIGFQEKKNGPIWPVELFKIPFMPDWEEIKRKAFFAVLPGVASRKLQEVKSNAKVSSINYPTEQAIVEETTRISELIVSHFQENDSSYFSPGAEAIRKERVRQISREGYDSEHDDKNDQKMLLLAAISYLLHAVDNEQPEDYWPFEAEYFKPKDFQRDAERAGALIAAAIDLNYRKELKKSDKQ